jgi:hypothetical protein
LAIFFMPQLLDDLRAAGPMNLVNPISGSRLVDVVKSAAATPGIRSFSLTQAE